VLWTSNGWAASHPAQTRDTGLGCWVADLPTQDVAAGAAVEWTATYADGRWEGGNYALTVEGTS
jgi:hypothetical protein